MATTEFNDAQHYGIFTTSATLTSQTGKMVRQSELVLSALRAQGVLDNMVDSATEPTHDKLWLDKNSDPAVLKEWDSVGSAWEEMTFDRLFGRAIVTQLTNVGGTANAITTDKPANFISERLYSLTPTANNTGAVTIQVVGVGTYAVKYHDGTAVEADEFVDGDNKLLLFTNGRFEVVMPLASVSASTAAAESAADRAEAAAASVDLPTIGIGDAGRVLAVKSDGTGYVARPTVVDTLTDLAALSAADVVAGRSIGLRYGSAFGGYGDADFYVLSGDADSNGLTVDGTVVVENTAGDITFVRRRWRDEGKIDCLWFKPALDGTTDSGTALDAFFDAVNALAPTQGRVHALIPDIGQPFLSATGLLIGSRVRLTGGGTLKAHSTLLQATPLLRTVSLTGGLNTYDQSDIVLEDIHFDGGSRTFDTVTTRQGLVVIRSTKDLLVRRCSFKSQESHLLSLSGNLRARVLDNDFSDWGYPSPTANVDGGEAIIDIANPVDHTTSRGTIISQNFVHDGLWQGIQAMGYNTIITVNIIRNVKECGIFYRNLNAQAVGSLAQFTVIANNIVETVTTAYVDSSGIVVGGGYATVESNVIRDTANSAISVVSEANTVDVANNTIINGNTDPATYPFGAGILYRDASSTLNPTCVRIRGNTISDINSTKVSSYGINCLSVSPNASTNTNVEITGNEVNNATSSEATKLTIDSSLIGAGTTWSVHNNHGSSIELGNPASNERIEVVTTNKTLTVQDTGKLFVNTGATAGVTLTLPFIVIGMRFSFLITDTDGITIQAPAGAAIRIGTSVSSTNRRAVSTEPGASVTLVATSSSSWIAESSIGTWTLS